MPCKESACAWSMGSRLNKNQGKLRETSYSGKGLRTKVRNLLGK